VEKMNIIIILLNGLHLLATIGWIGAMIVLMLIIIPSAKDTLQNENTFKDFIKAIGKKITLLVNISILIFFITGISLGILKEIKTTGWFMILVIKLVIVSTMVFIHICRLKVIAPYIKRKTKENSLSKKLLKLKNLLMNLVWVNLILGIVVLYFSVMM
jgi:uncharacterized membrane protein